MKILTASQRKTLGINIKKGKGTQLKILGIPIWIYAALAIVALGVPLTIPVVVGIVVVIGLQGKIAKWLGL